VPGAELEAVLELIQHAAAAGVDAGVVEGEPEVGEVGADVDAEDAGEDDGGEEAELLGHREDERPQLRRASPATSMRSLERETRADAAAGVLLLHNADAPPPEG